MPLPWGHSIQDKLLWCAGAGGFVWLATALALAPSDLLPPLTITTTASSLGAATTLAATLWMHGSDRALAARVDEAAKREPEPSKPEINIIHNQRSRATWERLGLLPVSAERFDAFAAGVLSGRAPTFREWTPRANGFSRPEFDGISAFLKRSGATDPKSQLTTVGGRALKNYLRQRGKQLPPNIGQEGESSLPW